MSFVCRKGIAFLFNMEYKSFLPKFFLDFTSLIILCFLIKKRREEENGAMRGYVKFKQNLRDAKRVKLGKQRNHVGKNIPLKPSYINSYLEHYLAIMRFMKETLPTSEKGIG